MTLEQIENLGRPLRADAERNRRRILVAAAEVFAKRGLDAGLDEIARHAGVGTATVYRRFPDKSMLIEALFESRIEAVLEMAETARSASDPWTGLVQLIENSVEMQLADRGLKELLFGEGGLPHAAAGARFANRLDSLIPTISAIVERAKDSGQLRNDVSVTDIAVMQVMLHGVGAFSAEIEPELWRRQLAILLNGLRAVAPVGDTALPEASITVEQFKSMCMQPPPATGIHEHHHHAPAVVHRIPPRADHEPDD